MIGVSLLRRERKMCELSSVRFAVSPNYLSSFGDIIQLVECSLCIFFFCSRSMSWSSVELLVGSALAKTRNKYFSIVISSDV